MNKDTVRDQAKKHRDRIDPLYDNPEDAVPLFLETIRPQKNHVIAGYWPKGKEFDCRPILDEAQKLGCILSLPKVEKESRILTFHHWAEDAPLEKGAFGIMEPKANRPVIPDIILVPMLAFDQRGIRLGYGGGYYDATLARLRSEKEIMAVGLAYGQQAVLFSLPSEDHDEPLDWVITPKAAHDFRRS